MNPNAFADRTGTRPVLFLFGLLGSLLLFTPSCFAKLETWRQETSAAFAKGHRERVVISDGGRVRLGQSLSPVGKLDAAHVWDLARSEQGVCFAATGDSGKVFRRDGKDDARWELAYDAPDSQAFALAVRRDGHVFVGTGPSGQVVDVTDPKHPASRPDPGVQYIWDLAADAEGNLYAATGPTGQLWKLSSDSKWSLILDSKHTHLLCVVVAPNGTVYAGSDGEGLIYRVDPDGKKSVVYDAPQAEMRTLLVTPDGTVFAGTAAESGGGSGSGRSSLLLSDVPPPPPSGASPFQSAAVPTPPTRLSPVEDEEAAPEPPTPPGPRSSSPATPSGGSAAPRPISPGDNAVYRIGTDRVPREVFRARTLIYALAWQDDHLLVGTGPEGQLYEVRGLGEEAAPIARLDNGQVLALLADPQGGLLLGAGDPGAVVRLAPGYVASGTLVSDVHDSKLISRFGALTWQAKLPAGTSVALQVRTGNVGEPDSTWSEWSEAQTDPANARAMSPPGRFVQYRVTLTTHDPHVTPELRSVTLRYQTANLAPEITKIDVPDVSASDGTTRQGRLTIRWDVTDPNGDDLNHTLSVRKEGWPDWVRLGDEPQTASNYEWDTTSVPAGIYRVRVSTSDRPSNNPAHALTHDRESEPFVVDHEAPAVTVTPKPSAVTVALKDNLTRLAKAAYALDGSAWTPVFPEDGLFDSPHETITITLPDLKPGPHILVVRATDAAGNIGSGDSLIEIPSPRTARLEDR